MSSAPSKPQPPPKPEGFQPWQVALGFFVCAMPFGLLSYARRGPSIIKGIAKNRDARMSMIPKKEGPLSSKEFEKLNPKGWKDDKNELF
jgi:hypothetical protein